MRSLYQVHSVDPTAQFMVMATLLGQIAPTEVQVWGVIVELKALDGSGTVTRRFYKDADKVEALAMYQVGDVIESVDTEIEDEDTKALVAPIAEAAMAERAALNDEHAAMMERLAKEEAKRQRELAKAEADAAAEA